MRIKYGIVTRHLLKICEIGGRVTSSGRCVLECFEDMFILGCSGSGYSGYSISLETENSLYMIRESYTVIKTQRNCSLFDGKQ